MNNQIEEQVEAEVANSQKPLGELVQDGDDKSKLLSIRVPTKAAEDFKKIAADERISQGDLFKQMVQRYNTQLNNVPQSVQVEYKTYSDDMQIPFVSSYENTFPGCEEYIEPKCQIFLGRIINYGATNDAFEAGLFANEIERDYGVTENLDNYTLLSNVCICKVNEQRNVDYKYLIMEVVDICHKTDRKSFYVHNCWYIGVKTAREVSERLSDYTLPSRRFNIQNALAIYEGKGCDGKEFIPRGLRKL